MKMKKNIYPSEKIGQSGGASLWRVCYQRGLPRLVSIPYDVSIFLTPGRAMCEWSKLPSR